MLKYLLFVFFALFLSAFTSASASQRTITVVHITTYTTQLPCNPKCLIAQQYFNGEIGQDLAWVFQRMPTDTMLGLVCKNSKCVGCAFCRREKGLPEIGGR